MNDSILNLTIPQLKQLLTDAQHSSSKDRNLHQKELPLEKSLIPRKEITQIFKISLVTLSKWQKSGVLPKAIKIGGRVFFLRTQILEMLKKDNCE